MTLGSSPRACSCACGRASTPTTTRAPSTPGCTRSPSTPRSIIIGAARRDPRRPRWRPASSSACRGPRRPMPSRPASSGASCTRCRPSSARSSARRPMPRVEGMPPGRRGQPQNHRATFEPRFQAKLLRRRFSLASGRRGRSSTSHDLTGPQRSALPHLPAQAWELSSTTARRRRRAHRGAFAMRRMQGPRRMTRAHLPFPTTEGREGARRHVGGFGDELSPS